MKDNILKYAFFVSLLLNVSLLGAAGYAHYRQTRHSAALVDHGARGLTSRGSSDHPHPFEALSLKPEQLRLFQEKAAWFHEALNKRKARVDGLRRSLLVIIRTDNPDPKAIETTIAEISNVQQEMQKMVVSHMLEFKSMLDAEQQKRFVDLIQGAMAKRGEMQCP